MRMRKLGRSGIEVSAMGLGCWAIGGPAWRPDRPIGWGTVDDEESVRAIHRAMDLGINFFDTANAYGAGHSERVLGRALKGRRDNAVVATKFSAQIDEAARRVIADDYSPAAIRRSCDDSRQRLGIDVIDLFQFHAGGADPAEAVAVRDTCEELVAAGKIRFYGWSTDNPAGARVFAEGPHCTAVQQRLNIFDGDLETLAVCEQLRLASINRSPLGMGLLTGKFDKSTRLPEDDVRGKWNLAEGERATQLDQLDAIRAILTEDGRTLAQAALGWIWAVSGVTIPIPGFKTVRQVEENVAACERGPLSLDQVRRIDEITGRGVLAALGLTPEA